MFSNFFIPLICVPISLIGFIDDKFSLKSLPRYIFHVFISCILIYFSKVYYSLNLMEPIFFIGVIFFLILLSTSIINFTNFMDGIDGIVVGCMAVIMLASSFYVDKSLIIIFSSLIAFLIFNWSPAKVFMGDSGSTFLGALFVGVLLNCEKFSDAVGLFLISLPLLADAGFCVLRRLKAGQKFYEPHRLHLYQRLNQKGWSHSNVSIIYIISTSAIAISLLLGSLQIAFGCSVIIFAIGFYLDQKVAITFKNSLNTSQL